MKRREFIAGLGGAAAIGGAALWRYVARARRGDRVRALLFKTLRTQADTAADKIVSFYREPRAAGRRQSGVDAKV